MQACNLGKLYDLITVYQNHFHLLQDPTLKEDETKWIEKGEIPNELWLFFCSHNGKVLMEELLFEDVNRLLGADKKAAAFSFLMDYKMLTQRLLQFYLEETSIEYDENDYKSFQNIGKMISASDLTNQIKSYLFAFLLAPVSFTQKLVSSLVYIDSQLSNLYENQFRVISDLDFSFDKDDLPMIVERFAVGRFDMERPTYYTFGALHPEHIKVWCQKECQLVYLGISYKNNMEKKDAFRLDLFGKIISEQNRIDILNYILKHRAATVVDINQAFGYSGSVSYYHLTMMRKAGMLNEKNTKDKIMLYSINSSYFDWFSCFLKKYVD
ncbi:MAG: helix-turn-helix transcriptional regulator [Clostridia bacterium]|nr:helix-turn-helix transcriptional regulator [Clostridia bacterium]